MARTLQQHFVQEVPLFANRRDGMILDQRLQCVGQLRNAGLGELIERAQRMRLDPRWVAARLIIGPKEKTAAYRNLKREYRLTGDLPATLVFEHWRVSKWMTEVIDSRAARALGSGR